MTFRNGIANYQFQLVKQSQFDPALLFENLNMDFLFFDDFTNVATGIILNCGSSSCLLSALFVKQLRERRTAGEPSGTPS